jgi:putative transposase
MIFFVEMLTLCCMKPTPEQAVALETTVELFTQGCNHALRAAKEERESCGFHFHWSIGGAIGLAVHTTRRSKATLDQPTSCAFERRTLSLREESVVLTTRGQRVVPKLGSDLRGLLARASASRVRCLTSGCLWMNSQKPSGVDCSGRVLKSRRLWKRLSGRKQRFVHTLAKGIVKRLEPDPMALSKRMTKCGPAESQLHNPWLCGMLRCFSDDTAALRGVSVAVDPHKTNQEPPRCGHTSRKNRRSQKLFRSAGCSFQHTAD